MSCIDAAIIKALVEHIGGNPDDVVVGGATTLDTVINDSLLTFDHSLTWEKSGSTDVLPTSDQPDQFYFDLGTIIKVVDDADKVHYYVCEGYRSFNLRDTSGEAEFFFKGASLYDTFYLKVTSDYCGFKLDCDFSPKAGSKLDVYRLKTPEPDTETMSFRHLLIHLWQSLSFIQSQLRGNIMDLNDNIQRIVEEIESRHNE